MRRRIPIIWLGGGLLALGLGAAVIGLSLLSGQQADEQRLYDRLDSLIGAIAEEHDALAEQEQALAEQAPIYGDDQACQKTGPGLGWCVPIPKPRKETP